MRIAILIHILSKQQKLIWQAHRKVLRFILKVMKSLMQIIMMMFLPNCFSIQRERIPLKAMVFTVTEFMCVHGLMKSELLQ